MMAVDMNGGHDAPFGDFDVLDERYRDADNDPPPPAEVTAKPLALHVAEMAKCGAIVRIPAGIATLDECMRGGLPIPRFVVVGGAPGTGKTSFVCRLAYECAKAKIVVGIAAVDEGPEGIVDRVALYEGCNRGRLDAGDTAEWARLATAVQDLELVVDDGSMTLEAFAAHLREVAGDRPAILISDSLQTVRCEGHGGKGDRREQVERCVRAHKRMVAKHKLLVIATCELARAFYRSEALAKELNPLAAFKESGSIEYAAQTAIILTNPKGAADLVDVTVAKNRGYRKEPFRLQIRADLSFHEVALPDDEEQAVAAASKPLEKAKRELLVVLAREKGLRSKDEVYSRVHGTKGVRIQALKELMDPARSLVVVDAAGFFRLGSEVRQ